MKISELIEHLKTLPQDKEVLCQVVGQQTSSAWNMFYEFQDVEKSSFVQLRVFHPHLKDLTKPYFDRGK